MRLHWILLFLCSSLLLNAQKITKVEFFVDTDPGYGSANQLPVAANALIDTTFIFGIDSLTNGLHTLYFRAQDDSLNWGLTQKHTFFKSTGNINPQIVEMEYFFDEDPGYGLANPIAISMPDSNLVIPLNLAIDMLSTGLHTLFIRAKADNGIWGFIQKHTFFKSNGSLNPNLLSAEYFLDTDPGYGNATPINFSPIGQIDSSFVIDLTNVTAGLHTLFVRALADNGTWSFIQKHTFFVAQTLGTIKEITDLEYYWNIDPGYGNGTAVDFSGQTSPHDSLDFAFNVSMSGLDTGYHQLYIRAKDNADLWSLYYTQEVHNSATDGMFPEMILSRDTTAVASLDCNSWVTDTFQIINNGQNPLSFVINENVDWLSVAPQNGSVPQNDTTTLTMTFDPTGLVAGLHSDLITIVSNDPNNDLDSLVVEFDVMGVGEMVVSTNALDFGLVEPNTSSAMSFNVQNVGCETITITTSFSAVNGATFSTNSSSGIIAPFSTESISVDVITGNSGSFSADIEVTGFYGNGTTVSETINIMGEIGCVISGNVALDSQSDIDNFLMDYGGCTVISGDLYIDDSTDGTQDITNLDGLSTLKEINGSLHIWNNNLLPSLNGLSNLESINGHLFTFFNNGLESLDGLLALENLGSINIFSNPALLQIDGLLGIEALTFNLSINSNIGLQNLNGLANLSSVSGPIDIKDNPSLSECCALNNLLNNGTIGGTVTMSNNLGNCNNNGADITEPCSISPTITFTQQPADVTVCAGNSATFSVQATSANTPISYQWQESVGGIFGDLVGETNAILTLPVVQSSSSGNKFRVFVNDGVNPEYSSEAILTVNGISITASPDVEICQGEMTTISINVMGGGTNTFLWNTGETTDAIAVSPTQTTNYSVTVTNSSGCTTDAIITVTVNQKPAIALSNQTNLTCYSLNEGVIEVIAMSGTMPYQFDLGTGNQNTGLFENLAVGTYNVSVSDANGCTDVLTTTLTAPSPTAFLDYEGNGVFTDEIIFPKVGTPQTDFTFKVKYTEINGDFPDGGVPKLRLDFEGNGQFNNPNDLIFFMQENDPADTDVTDGKDYFYNLTALPEGMTYQTSIIVENNSCPTVLSADAPDVLLLPDVEVRTDNIIISNPNPALGEEITISATVQNNSDFVASNFDVLFLNQFDMSTSTVSIGMLAPHQSQVVEWTFTTSMTESWNPVQVIVDVNDVIMEVNEFNNQAIRPFCNGDFACGGDISISANTTPFSQVTSSNGNVTLSGHAEYVNTAVVLNDPSVAGATVEFTVIETGASFTTFTNSNGDFSVNFGAPQAVGTYHIEGTITDYTISDDFTASFQITPSNISNPPVCNPDLNVDLNLDPFTNPILEGQSVDISGEVTVSVNNYEDATNVSGNISQPNGGANIPIDIGSLAAGGSQTFTLDVINTAALTPGTYSFHAGASANFSCPETTYSNNNDGASFTILPNKPDLVPNVHSVSTGYLQCQTATFTYRIRNIGGVASITSTAQLDIKIDNNLESSYQIVVPAIAAQGQTFVTFYHAFANVGAYQLEMTAVVNDANLDHNEPKNQPNGSTSSSMCVPNVVCSGLNFSPTNPLNQTNITLTAHFRNAGTATAFGPFDIEFSNGMLQTYNGDLAPNEAASVQFTIPTPTDCPTISFTINGESGCSRELGWDLELSNFCNSPTMWWNQKQPIGQGILFNVGAKNNSTFLAENVEVKFEIVSEGFSKTVTTNTVSNSCPNNVSNDEVFVFPIAGIYEVKMTIDPNNHYPECDESNNVFTVLVEAEDMPDLQVLSSNINPEKLNPDLDEEIYVEVTFENVGNTAITDPFTIELMRDNTAVSQITVSDNLLPNAASSVNFPMVSAGNPEGLHVFRAIVDNGNAISELDESNNEATRSYVVGDAVDFTVKNCSVDNPSPLLNETVNFSFDLENEGILDGEFDLRVAYEKDDGTIENIFLEHYILNGNQTITENLSWVVLDEMTTIFIEIYNPSLQEADELNNDCSIILNGFTLIASQTDASCDDSNDGMASVTVQGGTPPFNYNWSNIATTSSISNLEPGTYSVTVSDNFGNIKEKTFAIGPAELTVDLINSMNVSTIGGNDGSIEVLADGNTSPYSYNIGGSNQSNGVFQGLSAGTYEITVTDKFGCTETITETLTQPTDPIMIDGISVEEVTCFGGSNGEATVFVSGGTLPYQYDIGNGAQSSNILENLAAGDYTVTVTDATNASITDNFTIEDNNIFPMFTEVMIESEVSCFAGADGGFSLETYFGQPPFEHSIGNGNQSSSFFENLAAATYTYTVTDANGCSTTGMVTINQPDSLIVETQMATDASCFGAADGSLSFVKTGGNSGAIYNIGNGNQSSSFFPNLAAGTYTVTVTDGNGCSDTETATVGEPNNLMANIQSITNATTQGGGNDGEFTIAATGGTMPYLFDIGSQNNSNGHFTNLSASTYNVTITDNNNCEAMTSVTIIETNFPCPPMADFSYSNNALEVIFTNNSIDATDYVWDFGDTNSSTATNPTHTYATSGTYTVTLTATSDLCGGAGDIYTETITVYAPENIIFEMDNYSGFPDDILTIPVTVLNFVDVTDFQFTIMIDTALVEFVQENGEDIFGGEVTNIPFMMANASVDGTMGVSWISSLGMPLTLMDNDTLFNFKLRIKDAGNVCAPLKFTDSPVAMQATVNGINLANFINIDGEICVFESLNISGKVEDPQGNPINLAEISLSGSKVENQITGTDGNYHFTDIISGGNYDVCAYKFGDLTNGVNGLDIQAIQEHILGIDTFTHLWQYLAADVIDLGVRISGPDIYHIQQAILGNISEFPVGGSYTIIPDSVYLNSSLTATDLDTCFYYQNFTADTINQNFIAIKYGDVDSSADPMNFLGAGEVLVGSTEILAEKGDTVLVSIYAYEIDNLVGWQWTNSWNPEVLEFVEVTNFNEQLNLNPTLNFGSNANNLANGNLGFLWTSPTFQPISIEDSLEIFTLKFVVIGEEGSASNLSINSNVTNVFAFNSDNEEIDIIEKLGKVEVLLIDNTKDFETAHQLKIYPNPVQDILNVELKIDNSEEVTISLFNTTNQLMQSQKQQLFNGLNTISMEVGDFAKGVYWLEIEVGEERVFEKVILQ